ncbi:hypothetical protein [Spiroplasma diminutum]|uniref:Transmembrane protein n=1 Tax=Spiroplasma diminutum CUAS-1 TaxID=1276221 RepID=S5MIN5_9MOLU|nr:hypothetical protein [Spiroplasma diminutum]AGR41780.1 hypothetical protein SDIMI_v3c00760 [Spiroplasma diminutum CUAS-1]
MKINQNLQNDVEKVFWENTELNIILKKILFNKVLLIFWNILLVVIFLGSLGVLIFNLISSNQNGQLNIIAISTLFFGTLLSLIIIVFTIRKSKKLSLLLNEKIFSGKKLDLVYKNYFEFNFKAHGLSEIELNLVNPEFKIEKIWNSYKTYLNTKDAPFKTQSINSINFTFNNQRGSFVINNPIRFIERKRTYNNSKNGSKYKTVTTKFSSSNLFLESNKYSENFRGIKVKKSGKLKGDYKSESVLFNDKYSTNFSSTDLKATQFLTPIALDKLSNLELNGFNALGINNEVYVEKYKVGKDIFPIGIFDFTKLFTKSNLIQLVSKKIILEFEMLLDSLEYISYMK